METFWPTWDCAAEVRGRSLPACSKAYCMSPEQSKASGPVAPHTYGVPSFDSAASIAEAASPAGRSAAGFAAGATAADAWRVEAATVLYCGACAGATAATTGITPVVTAGGRPRGGGA